MITELIADTCVMKKYGVESTCRGITDNVDYLIVQAGVDHPDRVNELVQQGFEFLDRVLLMEIDLARLNRQGSRAASNAEIKVEYSSEYTPEMYMIAKQAFTRDRRFHLEPIFNNELAAPIIEAYIDTCQSKHMPVFKARHGSELLGYTIVDEGTNDNGKSFENVLGVTVPGIKGKMVASMLYTAMLDGEKAKFKKYVGRVSAANVASINLHVQLGGKAISVYDEYIYRRSCRKENARREKRILE